MKKLLLIPLLLICLNAITQNEVIFHCFSLNVDSVNLTVYEMKYKKVQDSLVFEKLEEKKGFVKQLKSNRHIITLPLGKEYFIVFKNIGTNVYKDLVIKTKEPTDEFGFEIDIDFSTPHTTILKYEEKRNCYVFKVIDKK